MTDILTLQEVCDYLRIHPSTMYRMIKRGQAPPWFTVGSDYRFDRASVDSWRLGLPQGESGITTAGARIGRSVA